MTAPASTKDELHQLIDQMSMDDAQLLLAYLNMKADPDELTPEEETEAAEALAEYERGETMSGEEFEREMGIGLSV